MNRSLNLIPTHSRQKRVILKAKMDTSLHRLLNNITVSAILSDVFAGSWLTYNVAV